LFAYFRWAKVIIATYKIASQERFRLKNTSICL
jgi:hypothetical protein